jgi:hypothetical protein
MANEAANEVPNRLPVESANGPRRTARAMLVAAMLATDYLDYFAYKAGGFGAADALDDRLLGHAPAPEQYRIGLYFAAHWLAVHLGVTPAMALALLDGTAGLVAVLLLFGVLERTQTYARASHALQWFGAAAFVLLIVWSTGWIFWLQKPETLPATALVAGMVWLWEPRQRRLWLVAAGLLVLTLVLATFRADLACLLNAGILLYALSRQEPGLALPRVAAVATAALGGLTAGGIQLGLMRAVYPQAGYGRVKLWQLRPNLVHATRWPPFVLFLLPLGWLLVRGIRRGFPSEPVGRALLCGALLYGALWITIGKIDEVRIFLPFAFALAPMTVAAAMQRVDAD